MKRSAQSTVETFLIAGFVTILTVVAVARFDELKMGLTWLSKADVKEKLSGELDESTVTTKVNIDECIRYPNGKCKVYEDSKGDTYVYVETAGVNGLTLSIVYLSDKTDSNTTDSCIGMLLAGLAKTCYDVEGNEISCDTDETGLITSVKITFEDRVVTHSVVLVDGELALASEGGTTSTRPLIGEPIPEGMTESGSQEIGDEQEFLPVSGGTTSTSTSGGGGGGGGGGGLVEMEAVYDEDVYSMR